MIGYWILIIFTHSGILSGKDSMSITNIPGFKNKESCLTAGKASENLVKGTIKDLKFVCVSYTNE